MKSNNIARLFALFANSNFSVWRNIIGCEVKHNTYGVGKVEKVIELNKNIYIEITFRSLPQNYRLKEFDSISFADGYFETIEFNHPIVRFNEYCDMRVKEENERLNREKIESKSLYEFNLLKQKYGLGRSRFTLITSPLYIILLKLESMEGLEEEDIQWLQRNNLFKVIAIYYERRYSKTKDLWDLVKASSNLRKSNEADRVIELLEGKNSTNIQLMSAILTTCGGAYRDINEIVKAEECAKEAIRIANKNYYSYNLLGAIYYQKGMPEDGDNYFNKAIELGSDTLIMDREIQNTFKIAGDDEKIRVANYLLKKDEQKYQWVKYYIKK